MTTTNKKLHVLHFHDCSSCGEGNAYYDRPGPMTCDHCGSPVLMTKSGQPFEDPSLD